MSRPSWQSQIYYGHLVLRGRKQNCDPEMKRPDCILCCVFSVSPVSSAEEARRVNRGQTASIIFSAVCQSCTSISWPQPPPVHHRPHSPLYSNKTTRVTKTHDRGSSSSVLSSSPRGFVVMRLCWHLCVDQHSFPHWTYQISVRHLQGLRRRIYENSYLAQNSPKSTSAVAIFPLCFAYSM